MRSPFENIAAGLPSGAVEMRAPRQMKILVPGAVAFGGLIACLMLNFLPASTPIMKLAGGLVLVSDLAVAAFLVKMFASRLVRLDENSILVRGPLGEKSVAWSQIASYRRISTRNGSYLSLCDASGAELVKIESFLGTREQRAELKARLDARVPAR